MSAEPPHYRPELDGLRAVAVGAVLVFHLNHGWLPGGFAGVDVFFVLSGYLVASIIRRGQADGSFRFRTFYQRRIARIFPAFLTMALATLLAARWIYSSWDLAGAGASFSAALLSTANFHLLMQGNYFQLSADAQPLLHCWSLSVEEQFYLLFPPLFYLLLRTTGRQRWIVLGGVTALSLLCGILLTHYRPVWAFYLLPARAWELLAGSLLAVSGNSSGRRGSPSRFHSWAGAAGLAAVLLSFFILREGPQFPGWQAVLPVLGTVAVIRYGGNGWAHALLSRQSCVALGRLSYSLYLWHWPVFSLVDYSLIFQSTGTRLAVKLILTTGLAAACYYGIERPSRAFLNRPGKAWLAFGLLAAAIPGLVPLGYAIHRHHYLDASTSETGALVFPRTGATRTLVLMGDSQGTMYGQMARDLAERRNLNLIILSAAGEDPLAAGADGMPGKLWASGLARVRESKPDYLILACHWVYKLKADPSRLAVTLKELQPYAGRIVVLTQPPLLPAGAERNGIRQGGRAPFLEEAADRDARQEMNAIVRQQTDDHIRVVDLEAFFTDRSGGVLFVDETGLRLFHDKVHLSPAGAERARPAVERALMDP